MTDLASLRFREESVLLKAQADPERYYLSQILPRKLELSLNYLERRTFWRDLGLILQTVGVAFLPALVGGVQGRLHGGKTSMAWTAWMHEKLFRFLRSSRRRALKILADAILVVTAYFLAYLIRFDGALPGHEAVPLLRSLPLLLATTLLAFYRFGLYRGLYEYSSVQDLMLLISAHSIGWAAFVVLQHLLPLQWTPRSVLVIYWLLGLILMGGVRFSFRMVTEVAGLRKGDRKRALIVGAGSVGEMIIRQMKLHTDLGYVPVCLVDDDPEKRRVSLHGVDVVGRTDDIPRIAKEKRIAEIVIAAPSAGAREMRRIVAQCEKAGVSFKTVPGPRELINGHLELGQLRGVKLEDLLDREPVRTDSERIAAFLRSKVVLVTGAGGSIGQELCRQIMAYKPEKVILFDRNENSLFYLENELKERWAGGYEAVVGDVCDAGKVSQVLGTYRPAVVFHAAAHKHVPLMELHPEEAIKNNLKGTMTVADLSRSHDVDCFVLISTDKAVDPVNIMGASKRLAELYVQNVGQKSATKFVTVRFGNVLGSNGSVVTLFQKQIEKRQPVTVTDPEMTRYFMTISEAVTLILQASAIGTGGEIFVLDMGEPVKVVEMARHLISLSGLVPDEDIPIEFTGRRPGEKIYEQLWQAGEEPQKTEFEKILVARCNGNGYKHNGHKNGYLRRQLKEITQYAEKMEREAMMAKINDVLPTYGLRRAQKLVA